MNGAVYLARHGSHAEVGRILSGRSEIGLSAAGRAEATWLADRLRAVPLAAIYTSPRARARQTAAIVAEPRGLAVQVVEALDEVDFGAWSGRSFAELEDDPLWQAWNERRSETTCPGGESMAQATDRARGFIEALPNRHPGLGPGSTARPVPALAMEGPARAEEWTPVQVRGDGEGDGAVLCVTHCDIIRGLVAHYLGLGLDRMLGFDCDPASLTTLSLFPGGARVVALNERMQ